MLNSPSTHIHTPSHGEEMRPLLRSMAFDLFMYASRSLSEMTGRGSVRIHCIRVKYLARASAYGREWGVVSMYAPMPRTLNDILIQTIMQLKSHRRMKASIHRRFDFRFRNQIAGARCANANTHTHPNITHLSSFRPNIVHLSCSVSQHTRSSHVSC